MDKYYTPKIEEFHIGLEHEAYNSKEWFLRETGDGWVNMIWEPRLASNNQQIEVISAAIDKGWIRVKYLDHQDIELLGWVYNKEYDTYHYSLKEGFQLDIIFGDVQITEDGECVFIGSINNISELRRLMDQLGIKTI